MEQEHEITDDTATSAEPAVEPAPMQQAEPVAVEPAPQPAAAQEPTRVAPARRQPSRPGQAVSGEAIDPVRVAACVFKNAFARKAMSVYHVQRRLHELGYPDAHTDKSGWYGDLTLRAVKAYQADNGLAGDGIIDRATLEHLFSDDPNVQIVD